MRFNKICDSLTVSEKPVSPESLPREIKGAIIRLLKRPLLAVCLLSAWTVCAQETPQPETPPAPPPSQRPALQAPAAPQSTTKAPASTLPPPDTKADIPKWDAAPSIAVVHW